MCILHVLTSSPRASAISGCDSGMSLDDVVVVPEASASQAPEEVQLHSSHQTLIECSHPADSVCKLPRSFSRGQTCAGTGSILLWGGEWPCPAGGATRPGARLDGQQGRRGVQQHQQPAGRCCTTPGGAGAGCAGVEGPGHPAARVQALPAALPHGRALLRRGVLVPPLPQRGEDRQRVGARPSLLLFLLLGPRPRMQGSPACRREFLSRGSSGIMRRRDVRRWLAWLHRAFGADGGC